MSFKKNKYKILKKAISKDVADFVYRYFLNKRMVARFYSTRDGYLRLLQNGAFGMTSKFLILMLIMEMLLWKRY